MKLLLGRVIYERIRTSIASIIKFRLILPINLRFLIDGNKQFLMFLYEWISSIFLFLFFFFFFFFLTSIFHSLVKTRIINMLNRNLIMILRIC